MSASDPSKSIFVIGSSYSGVGLAHKLLKHDIPDGYEVVLVGPSSSIYWNIAAPRALSKDNVFGKGNSELFREFVPGFAKYTNEKKFRFIQGLVIEIQPNINTVVIQQITEQATDQPHMQKMSFQYNHIVLATGAKTVGEHWPFKSLGTKTQTEIALREKRVRVEAASKILISGAGPTGVETAGEIATYYPNKVITLITSDDTVLPKVRVDVSSTALKMLEGLKVNVRTGVKVDSETHRDGKTLVTLTSGENIETDLHIPAYGLVPATGFLPQDMLDGDGWIKVTPNLNVPGHSNIWVVGDVASGVKFRQLNNIADMAQVVRDNIMLSISPDANETMAEFTEEQSPLMVPIGSHFAKGTGLLGSWKPWGFVVWIFKGRNYMVGSFGGIADGQKMPAMKKV